MKKIILAILTALLLSTTALAVDFPDVPRDGSERANAIYKLADAGIVGGYEDGSFRPDRHLTRAELCKIVNLIFGYNIPDTENFKDVKSTDWFYGYVLVAKKAGYIKGFEDNTFRGNTNLTREQTCIIISRTAGLYDLPMTSEIKDKVNDWAVADVKKVIANFIMPLPQDGKFRATENITRGELAMALDNFVKATITPPSTPSVPTFPSTPTTTTYTVKFYDGDGNVISTQTVNENGSATAPATPEKTDMEYIYTFNKWDTSFTNVQSNLHVRPIYNKTRILYTINLNYGNGTTGEMPEKLNSYYSTELKTILPTEGFSNGTLLFGGWYDGDNLIDTEKYSDLKSNTLTAKWVTTFTVTFYDAYGNVIGKPQQVKKGASATAPTAPKKATDKKFSYEFDKWDKSYKNVSANLDIHPLYKETPIIYTVTLNYGEGATGTLTSEVKVTYEQLLSDVLPTTGFKKEGYAFEGWSYNGTLVDGKKYSDAEPKSLTAVWAKIYIVQFYDDEDGNVISKQAVKKGDSATEPASPSKTQDNIYTYSFSRWDKTFTSVSGDLDIYPVFNKTERLYPVTVDYTTGKTETLNFKYYEEIAPRLPASVPHSTKLFAGWYVGNELIDNERYCDLATKTITAKWTDMFTVQFYDDEGGNVISKQAVKKGENATAPDSPEKAEDNVYKYTFNRWDKPFTNVQKNLDIYPVYTKTEKTYSVTLDYGNGTTKKVNYTFTEALKNKIPSNVENGLKTLLGWYVGDTKIDSHTYEELRPETITAKWANELIVNFYNAEGKIIITKMVKIGGKVTAPTAPKKASTNEYTYTFDGWDTDGDGVKDEGYKSVKNNLDVYPIYKENVRYYTVYLSYGDDTEGTMPSSIKVSYSENIADVLPTTGFSNFPFLFDGWYAKDELIDDESYADLSTKTLMAKWKADPEVLQANQPVIDEMDAVLYDIDHPLTYGFTKAEKRVLAPVKEAIGLAIIDAKAGYIVNKQYILDNYSSLIKKASELYRGTDEDGLGLQTDKDRENFYLAVADNLPPYTVNFLIDFFDVDINKHL